MENVKKYMLERFLKYVTFDTESCDDATSVPTTEGQFVFARFLEQELKAMGLMGTAGKGQVPPEQAIPEYGKSYIAKRSMEDPMFEAMQEEAAQCVGHSLSPQELNTLKAEKLAQQ